ncbi:GNAT family N-acetyltransferase [Sphingomonas sp. MMS24-JH45]
MRRGSKPGGGSRWRRAGARTIRSRRRCSAAVPAVFARIGDDAVADAAIAEGIAVVEAVAVDPALRRRGLARTMLAALLDGARDAGATHAALQVLADNAPAIALYRGLGFGHDLHDYHYRRRAR